MEPIIGRYFNVLNDAMRGIEATDAEGGRIQTGAAIDRFIALIRAAAADGFKAMFIGNGGSAAIASHMANEFTQNGKLRSMALNDAAALTCLGNDEGFENVFAGQIDMHGQRGDVLVAISCSGESPNILNGVNAALGRGIAVVTVSGFDPNNRLRGLGAVNFHVPSGEYGIVEVSSQALLHAALDIAMGWTGAADRPANAIRG
jgi:D-sedoheptulose 7-phosphate isomerase